VAPSASKPLAETLAALVELAVIAACIVGFVTIVAWVDALAHPPPRPGWGCWSVTRETATQRRHSDRCEPADGWHVEEWPGAGRVAVPIGHGDIRCAADRLRTRLGGPRERRFPIFELQTPYRG
jgi:hypothetical protein